MKRMKRCTQAPTRKPSTWDMWFETSRAGPRKGTFSCPTMRMRKMVWVSIQSRKRMRYSSTTVTM